MDFLIGLFIAVVICALLLWLYNKLLCSKRKKDLDDYIAFEKERAENLSKMQQKFEDERLECKIRMAARRMLFDKQSETGILWINPFDLAYCIYHEETAQFANKDIMQLVRNEFERMKGKEKKE